MRLLEKKILLIGLVFLAYFLFRIFFQRIRAKDGVDERAEPMYLERDVLGQLTDWKNSKKSTDKNGIPVESNLNIII